MTENTGKKTNRYCPLPASPLPRLTKLEQAIQDQAYIIAALRNKGRGEERPPGPSLKNDGDEADTPHSTVEKNISQDSVLKNSLKFLAEQPAKQEIPVETPSG